MKELLKIKSAGKSLVESYFEEVKNVLKLIKKEKAPKEKKPGRIPKKAEKPKKKPTKGEIISMNL